MKKQIPTSTAGEWTFFRHIQAKPGTNLIVSAWHWEYAREALVLNPKCLDWLWAWRKRYKIAIAAVLAGDRGKVDELFESETGVRLSAWMLSRDFPRHSLCEQDVWDRMCRIAEALPPCGGADEPRAGFIRKRFYGSPLDENELFPLMLEDQVYRELGVIERHFLNRETPLWMLPVELDFSKSNEFLLESFRLMLLETRKEFESIHGSVEIKSSRGKSPEAARVPVMLKELAASRLMKAMEGKSHEWKVAAKEAEKRGIPLYVNTSHKGWFRAKKNAQISASKRAAFYAGLQDNSWLREYEEKLDRMKERL